MDAPYLKFTDNKRDFVQFAFIKKWVQDRNHKSISSTTLYDALEETANYNPRYRDYVNKKDYSKCLQCCILIQEAIVSIKLSPLFIKQNKTLLPTKI